MNNTIANTYKRLIEKDRTENMAEKLSRLTAEESQILMKLLETGKTAEQGCSFFAEKR